MLNIFKKFFINKKWKNYKYLVAVSGGIDSIVLLDIFTKLLKNNIAVCNCNFNLNKVRTHNDLVKTICQKNNIRFFFKSFNTKKYIKKNKCSIQMGARYLRYKWFNKILKKYKYNYIVTGHHIDDDIETFFINLFRGYSLTGLKGIYPINKKIIRPYIIFNINKKKIYKYAKIYKLNWVEDDSNKKNFYLRNNIRNNLIRYIKKNYNLYYKNIYNSLKKLKIENNLLKYFINKIFNKSATIEYILTIPYINISLDKITKIKDYKYILYKKLSKFNFLDFNTFEDIENKKSGICIFSKNKKYIIIRDRGRLILYKNKKFRIKEKINKPRTIAFNKKKIKFDFIKKKDMIVNKNFINLDLDLIKLPIYIKGWRPGYKYKYKNKVVNINEIFKKNKISRFFKDKILFLIDSNNIILSSLNKILIYNKSYKINYYTKNILTYNFLIN